MGILNNCSLALSVHFSSVRDDKHQDNEAGLLQAGDDAVIAHAKTPEIGERCTRQGHSQLPGVVETRQAPFEVTSDSSMPGASLRADFRTEAAYSTVQAMPHVCRTQDAFLSSSNAFQNGGTEVGIFHLFQLLDNCLASVIALAPSCRLRQGL